nr:choice-of-anchor X domain-containing protein [Lysobacter sp. CAU 1642]
MTRALASVLALASTSVLASGLSPKQLAGPPEEFAGMQPADPARAAVISKSALIPLEFNVGKSGVPTWSGRLPVENGRARFLLLAEPGSEPSVRLRHPNGGAWQSAKSLARSARPDRLALEGSAVPGQYYDFEGLGEGDWSLELTAKDATAPAFLLIEGNADLELVSYLSHRQHKVGVTQQVVAMLAESQDEAPAELGVGELSKASLRLTSPAGMVRTLPMFDDGLNGDAAAGDGIYGARFEVPEAGKWTAQVLIEGQDKSGRSLLRSAEHIVPVTDQAISLRGAPQVAKSAGGRFAISLPVQAAKAASHVRTYAEVWGRDVAGNALPVAWIGGMSELVDGALSLGLDQRWIAKAGAQGPFELRNLRIEDADHFIPLLQSDALPLPLPASRIKAAVDLAIDESMRMGPRPASLLDASKGTGSRLLLVHGYCSTAVWPTSNFSNASTFLDANQNRSHDQFARLIRDYGATWNSFGVVAHSQGGAAALHLYTYYWSGLDKAGSGRLIQSVGTPYQGTNLAGVIAAIGGFFGVQCGSNDNMTYSGASAWLSGIPSWARSKVNYYTTGFRSTYWWVNDYCNFAADLVLSDPEDGTTEKAYGQLSGASNRGHTSGQCHVTGMRDPAQYLDSSRNSTMNSNAAR